MYTYICTYVYKYIHTYIYLFRYILCRDILHMYIYIYTYQLKSFSCSVFEIGHVFEGLVDKTMIFEQKLDEKLHVSQKMVGCQD